LAIFVCHILDKSQIYIFTF